MSQTIPAYLLNVVAGNSIEEGNAFDKALALVDTARRTMRVEDIDAALSALSALPMPVSSGDRTTLRLAREGAARLGTVIRYNDLTASYRRE